MQHFFVLEHTYFLIKYCHNVLGGFCYCCDSLRFLFIVAGGNIGNMVGIHLGRYVHDKNIKKRGMDQSQPLVIFTSSEVSGMS